MWGTIMRAAPASRQTFSGQGQTFWRTAWQRPYAASRAHAQTSRAGIRNFGGSRRTPESSPAGRMSTMFRTWHRSFRFSAMRGSEKAAGAAEKPLSLSQRLKKLSKEYGWSAVGVYFALSVLDFPFCFLLVRVVGTDRIGQLEHWVMSCVKKAIPDSVEAWWHEYRAALKGVEKEQLGTDVVSESVEMAGWGVAEAEEHNRAEASLGTQLALAYAIHKSFIFLRVPLTAAVTPKIVKRLRAWGWNIGKRQTKA
ncbi:hypothetical protein D7B24_007527 [Verticillium nonalfalfae]|uniref:DUF1279 domain-containing protein n=1 Tax=Verticillium nonalfalfae TaxID=1051616 RepID=A0A3M9Y7H1_9PEZI|nr:uncharacterized protein D7B24_007527 [Verticillium nonalfalfae]RNJ56244.1 hypothetical protein D7B24_007527 [Verticillium nonalfalfae]